MKILCVGEVMAELRSNGGGYAVGFAGDTFNTAIYCRRLLAPEHEVGYVSRLGLDPLSEDCLAFALSEGLEISDIRQDPGRNIGLYAVKTDERGERTFSYWRNQSAARNLFDDASELGSLDGAGIVCLSAITLAILSPKTRELLFDKIRAVRSQGALFAFDSNYRPSLWESDDVARENVTLAWRLADIALPSLDDELALFGDESERGVLERLRRHGCRKGALKRGPIGPAAINPILVLDGPFEPAGTVVDTTAAGDSFNGAYLAAFASSLDERTCIAEAHRLARHVVTFPGAIVPTPSAPRRA